MGSKKIYKEVYKGLQVINGGKSGRKNRGVGPNRQYYLKYIKSLLQPGKNLTYVMHYVLRYTSDIFIEYHIIKCN